MKRYLDLVPISAKIHRKQSRMSIFCIVLAVFLVTTIFGMADMFVRSQIVQARLDGGNFHAALRYITDEEAFLIAQRPEIKLLPVMAFLTTGERTVIRCPAKLLLLWDVTSHLLQI